MDDGAVGAGARDGVEAQIPEVARFLAEGLEARRRAELVDAASGRLARKPVQEARQRRAVARLRRPVAGDLDLVLDRLGQDRGVALRDDFRPGRVQRLEDRRHRPLGIDRHGLAGERGERRFEVAPLVQAHAVAEMRADIVADLLGSDEQVGGAVVMDEGEGERDRGPLHVLAAHVEGPGDRIERRQHRGVGLLLLQPVRHLLPLGGGALAGIDVGVDDQPRPRGLGPVGPDRVDRVAAHRDQLRALVGERLARLLHPVLGVQPGIVADPPAVGRVRLEPVGDAGLGHRLVAPVGAVDLVADLQRVAPVDEDRRFLRKHHRRARRALEAGQPGEPLRIAADIFAHMLVGQRHDEAVEAVRLQLLAQGREAVLVAGHRSFPMRFSPAR